MSTPPDFSVIIPCYNEQGNIEPLVDELHSALSKISTNFEILYVDDCSSDNSLSELSQLQKVRPYLRVIKHVRNSGQSASILTGYAFAKGKFIITMDGDLQNDPADIPAMYELLNSAQADMIAGVRAKRNDSTSKKISSKIANSVRRLILNDGIHDSGCTFRMAKQEIVQELPAFKALHRFTPALVKARGFKVVEMNVNHRARVCGVSKYGIGNRLWVGIVDMFGVLWFTKRSFKPNRGVEIQSGN